jgi:hypothetical protein
VVVGVSSSVYTNATPASIRSGDVYTAELKNPATHYADLHGHVGRCDTAPTVSTHSVRGPLVLAPSGARLEIQLESDECVYLVSQTANASTATVISQGRKVR